MNRLYTAALLVLSITVFESCCEMKSNSFVNEIEALVIDAEVNGSDWDDQNWSLFEAQLEGLMAGEYDGIKPCLEVTQEKRIENAYARGKDLLISENPMEGLLDELKEGVESIFE